MAFSQANLAVIESYPASDVGAASPPRPGRNLRAIIGVAAIVLLVLLVAFWPAFEHLAAFDEGPLLVYPELISHGAVPYRDFETFYGPLNLWAISAAYAVFGTNIFVERAVGLFYRMVILLAIFGLIQRWGKTIAAGSTLLSGCLLLGTGLGAYAWMGGVAFGLGSLWIMTASERPFGSFFAGLLAGLALLFRADLGPAVILSACPFLYAMPWRDRKAYCAGATIALLPLAGLTIIAGPQQLFNNLFFFPVLRSSAARHLPIFGVEPSLVRLFFAHVFAALLNVIAGVTAVWSQPRDRGNLLLIGLGLFGAAITHQAYQRLDPIHVLSAAFLTLGTLPLSLLVISSRARATIGRPVKALCSVTAVAVVAGALAPLPQLVGSFVTEAVQTESGGVTFLEQNGRSFPFESQVVRAIGRMLDKLDKLSTPGERLFVGPTDLRRTNYCDTYFYHLMPKLQPATYFLEMNPLSANRPGSRLAADLASADWLLLNRWLDKWNEQNCSREFGSDAPNDVVRENFVFVGQYGPFGLFRRKR
jgi:hypothetical protein